MEQAVETPCIRLCIRKGRELYSLSTVYTPFSTAFPYWRVYLSTIFIFSINTCFSYLYFSFVSAYPHYPHPIISITFFLLFIEEKERKEWYNNDFFRWWWRRWWKERWRIFIFFPKLFCSSFVPVVYVVSWPSVYFLLAKQCIRNILCNFLASFAIYREKKSAWNAFGYECSKGTKDENTPRYNSLCSFYLGLSFGACIT